MRAAAEMEPAAPEPSRPSRAARRKSMESFSEALVAFYQKPLAEQVEFWRKTQYALIPNPTLLQPKVKHWGDMLGRYFDGTGRGINFIIKHTLERRGTDYLDDESVSEILKTHYGYFEGQALEEAVKNSAYQELCKLLMAPVPEHPKPVVSSDAFRFALRNLRIGGLIPELVQASNELYHFDYDDSEIAAEVFGGRALKNMQEGNLEEYLVSHVEGRPLSVHWVHAHRPSNQLIIALGQLYCIRTHAMGRLCRLGIAQPQFDSAVKNASWNFMVFPAVYLDQTARRTLNAYDNWFKERSKEIRSRSSTIIKGGHKKHDVIVPRVSVSVVHLNLAVLWSTDSDNAERPGSVVSVTGEASYLGRWSSPGEPMSWWRKLCCATRRQPAGGAPASSAAAAGDEREPTPRATPRGADDKFANRTCSDEEAPLIVESDSEDEGEDELDDDDIAAGVDDIQREMRAQEAAEEAETNTSFGSTFRGVLHQLNTDNSVLRMGTHSQLAFRLILHGTSEYLDAIRLYKAAISRIRHYLHDSDSRYADRLIAKISVAKLELNTLLRMVQPFMEKVVPMLQEKVRVYSTQDVLASRVIRHYMIDIENNLDQVIHQCKAQIQVCEALHADYARRSGDRVNEILNFLTMITFLIMPMQILTGLYGMNFKFMPELHWEYGYHYFFFMAVSLTTLALITLGCVYSSFR